ncbi:hypothetical protein JKP88DRAFT_265477 [Tribonema minus]|uniref:J domain-containing protein n=1 Tax=Tribonema minus TaxID=303371 RepID=A0A835YTL3_9STRA|nr:hypothetical protein JKP88DRAFT_265477 [Tribonema minus]
MAPFAAPLTGDEMEPPDYYATLRVDRTATPKEIRAAYLGLVAHLHPDKVDLNSVEWLRKEALKLTQDADTNGSSAPETHTPAAAAATAGLRDMRAMADEQFQLIDRAFRVLSDPNKRHAYDAYGANGVRAFEAMSAVGHCDALSAVSSPAQFEAMSAVGHCDALSAVSSPAKVRELITRLVQQKRQQQLEATVGVHGSITYLLQLKSTSQQLALPAAAGAQAHNAPRAAGAAAARGDRWRARQHHVLLQLEVFFQRPAAGVDRSSHHYYFKLIFFCDALRYVLHALQVRELITRLVQQERQQQLEATVGAHGSVVVEATMLPLVDSAGRLRPGRLLPAVTHMVMQQAVDVPLSARTQGTFGGYVVARGGVGMGNASLGLRHALNARSWLSGGAELGFDPQINLTGGHTSSPGGATTTLSTGVGRHGPNLRYSVALRGGANTAVNLSWRVAAAGGRATVHVGQTREGGRSRARLELSLEDTLAPAARASYTRAFTQRTRGDVGVRLSAGGWELHANALRSLSPLVHVKVRASAAQQSPVGRVVMYEKQALIGAVCAGYTRAFTQRTRGDVGVRLSVGGWELHANALRSLSPLVHVKVGCKVGVQGVTVVLRFQRGGMRFHLPILLSAACDPLSILVGAVVPAAVDAAIRAVVAPTLRAEAAESERRVREAARRQRRRGAARAAAAKQVQLMLHAARRKAVQEEESGGLVILAARYGAALHADYGAQWFLQADNGGTSGGAAAAAAAENGEATDAARAALACEPRNIDVTVPLQFFVARGALSLPAGAKSALLGFYPVTEGLEHAAPQSFGLGVPRGHTPLPEAAARARERQRVAYARERPARLRAEARALQAQRSASPTRRYGAVPPESESHAVARARQRVAAAHARQRGTIARARERYLGPRVARALRGCVVVLLAQHVARLVGRDGC